MQKLRSRTGSVAASGIIAFALLPAARAEGPPGLMRDNSGVPAYTIPIEVPSGAVGATPELRLRYSPANGQEALGIGWDLPYSQISVDLREGVPIWRQIATLGSCNPDALAGRIFLDGMELVPNPADPLAPPGSCVFRTRPDTFALAVPFFGDGCGDPNVYGGAEHPLGWAVAQQDGTVFWYGDREPCSRVYRDVAAGLTNDVPGPGVPALFAAPATVRWLLHAVEDRAGNLVVYHTERGPVPDWRSGETRPPYDNAGCDGCLRAVTWGRTDSGSSPSAAVGHFRQLLADPRPYFPAPKGTGLLALIDWEDRPDRRVSSLAGHERFLDRRVKQIGVFAGASVTRTADGRVIPIGGPSETAIRTYRAHYQTGATGRSRLVRVHLIPGVYEAAAQYPSVFTKDPDRPKDFAVATDHMPWMVSRFDPESGEFLPLEPWPMPITHPWLMGSWLDGSDGPFPYASYGQDPDDEPNLFEEEHGLGLLALWEANNGGGRSPVDSRISVGGGATGPSIGMSMSLGPLSISLGATALGGPSASVGVGPVSLSATGLSVGPFTLDFATGSWTTSAASVAVFAIAKAIERIHTRLDVSYEIGFSLGLDGVQVNFPGATDNPSPDRTIRWQRQGLHDMNGDGCPDYVVAHQPEWNTMPSGIGSPNGPELDWLVLFNNGAGFDQPVHWTGADTQYISAAITEGYVNADGLAPPPQLGWRRSHEVAGLRDMNGDGLPDFVFYANSAYTEAVGMEEWSELAGAPASPYDPFDGPAWISLADATMASVTSLTTRTLWVQLNTGRGFDPVAIDWFRGEPPPELDRTPGHFAALSTARVHLQQGGTYNDAFSYSIAGLRDWNADGLIDYVLQAPDEPQTLHAPWDAARTVIVYLNDGTRFRSEVPSASDRFGRIEVDTSAWSRFVQLAPPPNSLLATALPPDAFLDLDASVLPDPPAGAVTQVAHLDLDGDGRLERVQTEAMPGGNLRLYPLQSDVPDKLVRIWDPAGSVRELEWGPARDFLDLPNAPAVPGAGLPISDGQRDAYPAPAQLLVREIIHDGLGPLGAPPIERLYEYADPVWLPAERRALGFASQRTWVGGVGTQEDWFVDLERAGLRYRSTVMEATGTLPSRESTAWDASEFAGNYPVLFQPLNWHYAPIGTVRDHFEPGFPGALSSETFRRFDTRNGLVICSLDDLERDGDWEKAAWTRWDDAMIADGVQVAAAEEALHILPPGFGNGVEDCRRDLPNGTMVRRTTRVFEPRGFVDTEVQHDATGQSPSRTQNWAYTARGLPDEWIDAAGESHLYGYDPVFGAFLLDTTDPDTTNSFGSTVVHASEVAYCGISGTACPAAAWGLPVSAIDPSGLETVTSYDLGGRAVESWDSLSPAAFGTVVKRQASYGRAVRRAPVDALPGPGTETAPSFTLIQQPIGTPGSGDARTVVSQTFSDGLGRPLLTRTQTVDGEGAPAEQVSGVTVRDERGRAVIAYGACFSYAGWSDGLDLLGAFSPMSPDLGTCAVPPAATSTQWDSHDRAASVEGPDGTILERDFGLSPGIAIAAERLIDPQWGLLSETTVRTAPTLTETTRHGASTFRHTALQGPQPAMPSPDASDLVTWDVRDVLGRRTMLSRTGTPPGEESVWEYDGFDGVVFSADPDQGRFAYEYDGAGRVAARTLLERNAPNVVFRTERAYDAHSRLISEEHLIDAGGVLDPWERTDWEYDTAFPTFGGALADAGGHVGRATSVLQSRWDGFTYADTVGQAWRYDLRGRVVEEAQHRPSWPSFPMGLVSAVPALLVAGYAYADHGVRTKQLVYVDDGVCRATRSRPAVDEMRLRSGERQASRAAHARPHGGRSGVAAPVVSSTARARPASQADRVLVRRPEGRGPGGP